MRDLTKEEKKDEMKNRISLALKDPTLQQGFEIICKENAELKSDNDARKFAMAMSEKVEKQLREENAELKEKLNLRSCQNCKRNNRTCPNDGSCEHYSKWEGYENLQLTKATELLKHWASSYGGVDMALCKQTLYFLSEVEK